MITADILGKRVELVIELVDAAAQKPAAERRFAEMADTINAVADQLTPEQADTFRLTDRLTLFREKMFRGFLMKRSFMDQRARNFHWTIDEFTQWDPAPRRPTAYFHDAWHIRQFIDLGEPPNVESVLIDREQDAMARQLAVARILRCDQTMLDFLTEFANNRDSIRERLLSGVGADAEVIPHFRVFD